MFWIKVQQTTIFFKFNFDIKNDEETKETATERTQTYKLLVVEVVI